MDFPPPKLDVPPITRREGEAGKLARPAPPKRDMLAARWLAEDAHRGEDNEKWRVGIGDGKLLVAHLYYLDAEFFVQLSVRRVGVRLPGLALPARELPEPAVALVVWPLTHEELVLARHDGGDDSNEGIWQTTLARGAR